MDDKTTYSEHEGDDHEAYEEMYVPERDLPGAEIFFYLEKTPDGLFWLTLKDRTKPNENIPMGVDVGQEDNAVAFYSVTGALRAMQRYNTKQGKAYPLITRI